MALPQDINDRHYGKYRETISGVAVAVANPDGSNINSILPTGSATSINQTNGSQKTQIVDSSNTEVNLATSTNQETLETLVETLQEVCRNMASIASARGIAADLRVTMLSGTINTVAGLTNIGGLPAVGVVEDLANMSAQFNINNVVG